MEKEQIFTFSSNNTKEHYSSYKTEKTPLHPDDHLINKVSVINTHDYSLTNNIKLSQNTLSYFLLEANKFTSIQKRYSPDGKISDHYLHPTFYPQNSLLNLLEVKYYKVFYDSVTKNLFYLLATQKRIFYAKMSNNEAELLIDLSQYDNSSIKGIFLAQNKSDDRLYVILSYNLLLEIDLTKSYNKELIDNLIKSYMANAQNNKKESNDLYNVIICEFSQLNRKVLDYEVLTFNNQANIVTTWKFNNEELIRFIHIAYFNMEKMLCLILDNGVIRIINYAKYDIEAEYKTQYGNIRTVTFSDDGLLMGLGVEDDNAYIIDNVQKKIIFVLDGHHNFISQILFSLQNTEEETLRNKTLDKQRSLDPIPQLLSNIHHNYQEASHDIFLKAWEKESTNNTKENHWRNRANSIRPANDQQFQQYDIYTSGLDGYICSWKIEVMSQVHQHNSPTNKDKGLDISNDSKRKQFDYPIRILLEPLNSLIISPMYIERISPMYMERRSGGTCLPIVKMIKVDLILGTIFKRNPNASKLLLSFYYGTKEKRMNSNKNTKENLYNKQSDIKNASKSEVRNGIATVPEKNNNNSSNINYKSPNPIQFDLTFKMNNLNQTNVKMKSNIKTQQCITTIMNTIGSPHPFDKM